MKPWTFLACVLFSVLTAAGCGFGTGGSQGAGPYESCSYGEYCGYGLSCADTTLPVSAGYTGSFCTAGCNYGSDCPQVVSNYEAICVNGQCYLQCPTGSNSCPYGQGCFTFRSNAGPVSLCTP